MNRDRDEALERLLRESSRVRGADAVGNRCLDAETLAAWTDGTLSRTERSAAEAHAADCVRCQSLLAAMIRTAPPVAARPWWRVHMLAWATPLAAASAAALVWAVLPVRHPLEQASAVAPAGQIAAAPSAAPGPPPTGSTSLQTVDAKPKKEQEAPPSRADAAANDRLRSADARREADALDKRLAVAAEPAPRAAPTQAPPPPLSEAPPQATAPAASAPAAPAVPPPPPAAPAAIAEQVGGRVDADAARAAARAAEAQADPARAAASQLRANAVAAPARERLFAPPPPIASPTGTSRWRIAPGGVVQHSTDGGATWESQQTGATVTLTAGSASADLVCWFVGPGGVVVVTTDGRSWRRAAIPEAGDLVAVTATDGKSAVVTTAAGRKYTTTDGGQTWVRTQG